MSDETKIYFLRLLNEYFDDFINLFIISIVNFAHENWSESQSSGQLKPRPRLSGMRFLIDILGHVKLFQTIL